MKKILLSFILVIGVLSASAQINWGIKVGFNGGMAGYGSEADMKPSVYAGAHMEIDLTSKLSIQPELIYSRQGFIYNLIADEYAQGSDTYRLNYINLPVIFKYYVGNRWSVDFGPQFGVMLNASYVEDDGYLAKDPVGVHYQFSSFDTSFCIGTTFNFTDNIAITVRYNQGLIDCYKDEVISIHNNVLQAGLDFSF